MEDIINNSYETKMDRQNTDGSRNQIITNHNKGYPMKTIFLTGLLSMVLISCGGDGGSDLETGSTSSSSSSLTSSSSSSLSDDIQKLQGVWSANIYSGDDVYKELYFVFRDNDLIYYNYLGGGTADYSFLGEGYENGANCYFLDETNTITDLGNGSFTFTGGLSNSVDGSPSNIQISFDSEQPVITYSNGLVQTLVSTSMVVSDFAPICDLPASIVPPVSSSTSSSNSSTNSSNASDSSLNLALSISEFEGVWDASIDYGSAGIEELYFDIQGDTLTYYNYLGDDFDNGDNCYFLDDTNTISNLGNGTFSFTGSLSSGFDGSPSKFQVDLRSEGPVIIYESGLYQSLVSTTMTVSDFTPLCDLPPNTIIAQ